VPASASPSHFPTSRRGCTGELTYGCEWPLARRPASSEACGRLALRHWALTVSVPPGRDTANSATSPVRSGASLICRSAASRTGVPPSSVTRSPGLSPARSAADRGATARTTASTRSRAREWQSSCRDRARASPRHAVVGRRSQASIICSASRWEGRCPRSQGPYLALRQQLRSYPHNCTCKRDNRNAAHQAPIAMNFTVLPARRVAQIHAPNQSDSPPPGNPQGHYTPKSAPRTHPTLDSIQALRQTTLQFELTLSKLGRALVTRAPTKKPRRSGASEPCRKRVWPTPSPRPCARRRGSSWLHAR
jgi:hypothetical protein